MTALCYTAPSPSCVREVVTLLDGSLGRRCLECAVARPICHSFQVYNVLKLLKCGCATDDAKNSVVCDVVNRIEVALCSPPSRTSTGGQTGNWSNHLGRHMLHCIRTFGCALRCCIHVFHLVSSVKGNCACFCCNLTCWHERFWTVLPPIHPALSTKCWRR